MKCRKKKATLWEITKKEDREEEYAHLILFAALLKLNKGQGDHRSRQEDAEINGNRWISGIRNATTAGRMAGSIQ